MTKNTQNTDLPIGWVRSSVGELYQFEYGKSLTKQARTSDGEYPVFGSNGVVGNHDSYLIEGPVLVVGRKGAAGAVSYSIGNCWPIDTTYFVRDNSNLDFKFSYYLLQSLNLSKHEKSTAIPGLNRNDAYAEPVLLPPLSEQKRIVAKIEELFSELDKGIESFKTARKQLKVYRQALLKHAFEGKLTAAWREANRDKLETTDALMKRICVERAERYKQQVKEWEQAVKEWEKNGKKGSKPGKPAKPKELPPLTAEELAELPELPDGWGWVKLGHIQSEDKHAVKAGPFGSALKKEFYVANGFKVYGQEQVISGDHEFGNYFVDGEKYRELISCSVKSDDVLISLVGTIGKVLVLPSSSKPGIINPRLVKVSLKLNHYRPRFFKAYFESSFLKSLYANESQGTTMDILNLGIIQNLPYPFCAIEEQDQVLQEIETRFSEIDLLDQTITTALQQAETLRQSILKKAFSGQLVPQDPNDEPASELLARIKAERAIQGEPSKNGIAKHTTRKKKATP